MERPKSTVYWDKPNPNFDLNLPLEHSSTSSSETMERIRCIRPMRVMDWDKTDPATGLSMGCKVACEIIDGLDHHELHLFNAPRRDNPAITAGELIETYMALKSRKRGLNDVNSKADDGDSDGPEDGEGDVFAVEVVVKGEEVEGWTMAKEDEVPGPIMKMTRTRRKSPIEDTNADEVRVTAQNFGREPKLQEFRDLGGQ